MAKKFYVIDKDGCGYEDSILITNNKNAKAVFIIAEVDDFAAAKRAAARYIYDTQRQIDKSAGEDMTEYPEFEYNDSEYDFETDINNS